MITSGSGSESGSPTFLDSLVTFRDRVFSEAEDLFSLSPPTSRSTSVSEPDNGRFSPFSFPWSSKTPEPGELEVDATEQEPHTDNSLKNGPSTGRRDSSDSNSDTNSWLPPMTKGGKARLKREGSVIKVTKNGKLENATLLQYSAVSLTIQNMRPGDIPSFPDIIDDLYRLEGANPIQVRAIVDKIEALKLTIASLDKRLEKIDRGLDLLSRQPPPSIISKSNSTDMT